MQSVALPCSVSGVALDSSGSTFYAGGGDGFVYNGSVEACEVGKWGQSQSGSIVSLALVNEERNVVSAAEDGSVWMWDVEKGEVVMVFGDELITLSDMIVIKGNGGGFGVGKGHGVDGEGSGSFTASGLCDEEILKTLNQMTALGEVKDVVLQDRKKAIEMLESVIEMYERLLKLILKEATKAIEEEEKDDDEDKDDDEGDDDDDEKEHEKDDTKEEK